MINKKPNNNTKPKKKDLNEQRHFKRQEDLFTKAEQEFHLTSQHATDSILERFADNQLEYFNTHPDKYHVERYRIMKGVSSDTYYGWCNSNEYLRNRHNFLMELLALRRKERVAEHDPKFLTHTLHMYSPKHDEANKYKARLKKLEEEDKKSEVKVVFEDLRGGTKKD